MRKFGLAVLMILFSLSAWAQTYQPVDKGSLPALKQSKLGLYLSAQEAYDLKMSLGDKALFVDIRTKGEFMFLGSPNLIDANIPYVEMDDPTSWDKTNKRYKLSPNSDFVAAVKARMEERKLSMDDTVILICRSGDRSGVAANLLQQAGYSKVYSVVDGFEGDMGKNGRRDLNGWKNAGLPWTYQMDEQKAYLR